MVKFTKSYLTKLEDVVSEGGFIVRYERGNFKSGFCVLKETKLVLINNFLPIEGRVNCLLDLVFQLELDEELMTEKSKKLRAEIKAGKVLQDDQLNLSSAVK